MAAALKRMVGFRNIAAYDYQRLNRAIVRSIIEHELDTLRAFAAPALKLAGL